MTSYRQVGGRLGAYIRANNPNTQQVQGLLADLLAGDKLLPTTREVVSMPEFAILRGLAGSGGGVIQRDALLKELSKRYLPIVVNEIGELLNGMLDQPASHTSSSHQGSSSDVQPNIISNRSQLQQGSSTQDEIQKPKATAKITTHNSYTVPNPDALLGRTPDYRAQQDIADKSKNTINWIAKSFIAVIGFFGVVFSLDHLTKSDSNSCIAIANRLDSSISASTELIDDNKDRCSNNLKFLVEAGKAFNEKKEFYKALEFLDDAISVDAASYDAFLERGRVHENLDQPDNAINDYAKASELDTGSDVPLYQMALTKYGLGRYNEALYDIDLALERNKDNLNYEIKGDALNELGRHKDAVAAYNESIRFGPSSNAYWGRSISKGFLKDHNGALIDIEKAIELDKKQNGKLYVTRGTHKTWLDDDSGACADFKKAKYMGVKKALLSASIGGGSTPIDDLINQYCI